MKYTILMNSAALVLLAGQGFAQGITGSVDLSYSYVDATLKNAYTESLWGGAISGDYETSLGWYFGGEYASETANNIVGGESYESGTAVSLRAGNTFGWGTGEVFAGWLSGTSSDGTAERYFGGISVGKAISSNFSINGQIGYLDGDDVTGDLSYDDMLSQAVFAGIGGTYGINDALSIDFGISGATGVIDQDKERADISEVSIGVNYILPGNPAWTLYSDASYTHYFQYDENDQEDIMQVALGVSYSFGGNSPRSVLGDTLPFAQWASVMEGVLE